MAGSNRKEESNPMLGGIYTSDKNYTELIFINKPWAPIFCGKSNRRIEAEIK